MAFDWYSFMFGIPVGLLFPVLIVVMVIYLERFPGKKTIEESSENESSEEGIVEKDNRLINPHVDFENEVREDYDYFSCGIDAEERKDKVHVALRGCMYNHLYDFRLYENVSEKVHEKLNENRTEIENILNSASAKIHNLLTTGDSCFQYDEPDYLYVELRSKELTEKVHVLVDVAIFNHYEEEYPFIDDYAQIQTDARVEERREEIEEILNKACEKIHAIVTGYEG